ncbi:DUF937 domain-containing protein [Telmatocola sphagniphila]|jgi:uncharacterized protein YidB (DUF937 family)|uniref:DUF937 domain-containing protein n=1 Tax=Telmatocola sphagniphila TaxID=1123043 RepID=A0A8E6B2F6_9BACT|nr:YidB family protein [Telmatocola sphagniphila]QVL30164.1 DUF937 domain-containing protein [Telmatocola sphagniphila]
MGILINLIQSIISKLFAGNTTKFISVVTAMLQNKEGGLAAILEQFQKQGMGHLTSSWVGTGENADVSEEQLQQGLGQDKIQELIKSTGLSEQDLLAKLKEHLPKIIDKLTPEGKLPE